MLSPVHLLCPPTLLGPTTSFALEAPAGIISVEAECDAGRVSSVTLRNQPAYCRARDMDVQIDVPEYGKVQASCAGDLEIDLSRCGKMRM